MEMFPKFKHGMKAVTQGGGRKSEITFFFTKPSVFPSNMKSTSFDHRQSSARSTDIIRIDTNTNVLVLSNF